MIHDLGWMRSAYYRGAGPGSWRGRMVAPRAFDEVMTRASDGCPVVATHIPGSQSYKSLSSLCFPPHVLTLIAENRLVCEKRQQTFSMVPTPERAPGFRPEGLWERWR